MDRKQLKEILNDIALEDLTDGENIYNHPCSVAIRAIDKCFDDINLLRVELKDKVNNKSKQVQTLVKSNYDPRW